MPMSREEALDILRMDQDGAVSRIQELADKAEKNRNRGQIFA
jgi:hypothetical protein